MRAVTAHGDKATAVGWSEADSLAELQSWQTHNSMAMLCDVRLRESVERVITQSVERWGRIDIIAK